MVSNWFLRCGASFAVVGMLLGIAMAASHDHRMATVHAHVNLVGWVSMFLAGLFYRADPSGETGLARLHLGLAVAGLVALAPGIAATLEGLPWGEPLAVAGALTTLAAALVFAVTVFRATRIRRAVSAPRTSPAEA